MTDFKTERDEAAKIFATTESLTSVEFSATSSLDFKAGANFTLTSSLVKQMAEALEDALETLNNQTENMQHYFDNKCVPTVDEVNQCALNEASLRIAIGRYEAALKELK